MIDDNTCIAFQRWDSFTIFAVPLMFEIVRCESYLDTSETKKFLKTLRALGTWRKEDECPWLKVVDDKNLLWGFPDILHNGGRMNFVILTLHVNPWYVEFWEALSAGVQSLWVQIGTRVCFQWKRSMKKFWKNRCLPVRLWHAKFWGALCGCQSPLADVQSLICAQRKYHLSAVCCSPPSELEGEPYSNSRDSWFLARTWVQWSFLLKRRRQAWGVKGFSHWWHAVFFLTLASKFKLEPNGGIFEVSPTKPPRPDWFPSPQCRLMTEKLCLDVGAKN